MKSLQFHTLSLCIEKEQLKMKNATLLILSLVAFWELTMPVESEAFPKYRADKGKAKRFSSSFDPV